MAADIKNELVSIASSAINPQPPEQPKWRTLAAGATAGLVVDTSLYPIDTIKSRLQSKQGFKLAGGFTNLYRGLPPVLIGSIPNGNAHAVSHMVAASLGEITSCLVRVPYEVIKMRSQTMTTGSKQIATHPLTNMAIYRDVLAREGYAGLYRGFASTIYRDLPFSALQYPIWEKLKARHHTKNKRPATPSESAYYGSIAGGIAAFLTNPLDVAKTRIMLASQNDPLASGKLVAVLKVVLDERGMKGLFAGVVPRVVWISVGAFIFLGSYEKAIKVLTR